MEQEQQENQNSNPITRLIIFVVVFVIGWYGYNYFLNYQLVNDALKKFEIVEKTNDKAAICSEMGSVASTYLYVKNEKRYLKWKDRKNSECSN